MKKKWLFYALITTFTWGIWGALIEIPEKNGFPATFGYITWSFSMIPCALVALYIIRGKIDTALKSVFLGSSVGLLGAGGQLILFEALRLGPAYIVFPFVSMSPVVTITLSLIFLHEKATNWQKIGIVAALLAIFLLSYKPADSHVKGYIWIILSSLVFLMWGVQGFIMKFANKSMKAESVFIYMTITAIILAPIAYFMTDFNARIDTGWHNILFSFFSQILNAIGALTLVYAYRYGNAIIVSPMTGLAPLITIVLSLIIYSVFPSTILLVGLILATIAMISLSIE
ncbi:MAG TPA: DMT family transporter [Paludibacteraceae bacterium]|nr:DMT family transporter [Paludibacteraceae bacterium]HOV84426.1 DMT family transporter [Paludibacteraceae bacterium]